MFKRRRRGSLLLVITFATSMAMVAVGMMILATNLYSSARYSADNYADIQSYRAAAEMACYQYITDLESVVVTKDLDADWISVSGNAVYTQALEAIKDSLASETDSLAWFVADVREALSGVNLSDPLVLTELQGKLAGARQSFSLIVPEPFELDWADSNSWRDSDGANIALSPVLVEVTLAVRGETVYDRFTVDGLYLVVNITQQEIDGSSHDVATMYLAEMESGVEISRAPLETET